MSNKKHIFQMTTEEFFEVFRKEILSIIEMKESIVQNKVKDGKDYYTREEAKDLLKISYATLWKYNKDGVLRATKIGSRVYYKRKDIDDAMEGGCYV
ncbi:excisionase family DNA binding protein [Jejuia pallidilutea]|uniref:Excisionase family DNA binding protein n=1 Tax=Jejuia pallidilutea TaxID=504487 RepID=A0A362X488_9FLAO|nr:helix-turn-helix domain-containing protein [Jejuia pallidilutea]PQV51229.1 excisionase family DNA binding protein [Jejuia pallidilutea]